MTRHDELYENYEDALFALLMAEIAEEEGKRYLEENERLNNDPDAEVPESLDRKCRKIIKREFDKKNRYEAFRVARKVLNIVAIVALVSMLLFTTAYALVPEARIRILNMLIEVSDVATSLTFGGNTGDITSITPDDSYFGYTIPVAPEGFSTTDKGSSRQSVWVTYEDANGSEISFYISGGLTSELSVDTEDADSVEQILIHGYEGLLIVKGERIHVVWGDTDQNKFVNVICTNTDVDTVISLANNMR